MKKNYNNKKGATSILVVFIIVVLITLGAFAILSSNSNYSFSKKVLLWNEDYYALENISEGFIASVDNILIKSENEAVDYILNKGFEEESSEIVPNEVYEKVKKIYTSQKNDSLINILNEVYFYYATKNLEVLKNTYEDMNVYKEEKEVFTNINFSSMDKKMNLNVVIKIVPVSYDIANLNDEIIGKKNVDSKRFIIIARNQWQEEPIYDNELDLWHGVF